INDAKAYSVKVFDMQGRVMASEKNWDTDRLSIGVSSLIAGTYCYTISDGTIALYSGKFVKI
ncbi:MAG TPA: T9SS type A sorting domain-containing protein, partial [Saprospiraceae bacterium]|nr:T9SS type A sorting domain-containing protein [Saprospiraceae bacterium]